jgi:GNAT superfamily N-acetyltransferase
VRLAIVSGEALRRHIPDLARLRIAVFREYPYLYDGTEAYEADYLATYTASGQAMAVLAVDGEQVVGASTGIPLAAEDEAFRTPFEALGIAPASVFYCGESVLLPAWRGQGLYREFFTRREAWARALPGVTRIGFCAVQRPETHPLCPADWEPLDAVWRHFGYAPDERLSTTYSWKDIDQPDTTAHPMQFWMKQLDPPDAGGRRQA